MAAVNGVNHGQYGILTAVGTELIIVLAGAQGGLGPQCPVLIYPTGLCPVTPYGGTAPIMLWGPLAPPYYWAVGPATMTMMYGMAATMHVLLMYLELLP